MRYTVLMRPVEMLNSFVLMLGIWLVLTVVFFVFL